MVQKVVVKREFEAGLRHETTGKVSVKPVVNGYLFRLEKDKAAKGEGWTSPFISCVQDIVGL